MRRSRRANLLNQLVPPIVIPAKAGLQAGRGTESWISVFAGMTPEEGG